MRCCAASRSSPERGPEPGRRRARARAGAAARARRAARPRPARPSWTRLSATHRARAGRGPRRARAARAVAPRRPGHLVPRYRRVGATTVEDGRSRRALMAVDKPTERAQEALAGAARVAEERGNRSSSPTTCCSRCSTPARASWARCCERAGADPVALRAATEAAIARRPQVSGRRPAAPSSSSALPRACCAAPGEEAETLGDEYISTEHLLLALVEERRRRARRSTASGVTRDGLLRALREVRGRPARHRPEPRGQVPGAREVRPRPDRARPSAASSTRSSAATRRSGASSRCSRGAPRTTRS